MCSKCYNSFLAIVIIVFSFWTTSFSWWAILIAAALILISQLKGLSCCGCSGSLSMNGCPTCNHSSSGEGIFLDDKNKIPSKDEVKKTINKK